MKTPQRHAGAGFTLVELMVALALGLIVMAAMASLFKTGLDSTMLIMQRAEDQENMRAALELMVKDVSMAGAGLPSGGIQLPTGAGSTGLSKFGCDQTGTCHVPAFTYPNTPTSNYMYGIIPGYRNGVEASAVIPAAPTDIDDSITVIYADYNFPLFEYTGTFVAGSNGSELTLTPIPGDTPPPINSAGGIQVGDLVMVSGAGLTGVGEVTNLTGTSLTFADLDPLNINQSAAASGNLAAIQTAAAGASVSVIRLFAVTYYLTVPAAGQTPRLMRQVNGLSPVPVADDIINLQFAYDVYNSANNALDANQPDVFGAGDSPNNVQKVNVVAMGQSILNHGNRSQNMYLATSVSARNMAFRNRYQ